MGIQRLATKHVAVNAKIPSMRAIFAVDPTRTTQLRKRFVQAFNRRWSHINKLIRQSVVVNDCFGLRRSRTIALAVMPSWAVEMGPLPAGVFQFRNDLGKIDGFTEWLQDQVDKGIFTQDAYGEYWFNPYQLEGYERGIAWARRNVGANAQMMAALGLHAEQVSISISALSGAVKAKQHVEKLKLLYSRSLRDLKGITSAMDTQISRVLADGLLAGESADKVARDLVGRVDKIGKHRATLLARTEIIRAHHVATIAEYRLLGVDEVEVQAEWLTAKDARVCDICRPRNKKRYSLDEVEPMIPVHPQCRCTTIPVFGEVA